mgnify:CR=1 FL=1
MWNNKRIIIYTIVSLISGMIVFEVGYCNTQIVNQIIIKEKITYNFSLCRIMIYILFITIYIIFKDKFVNTTEETMKNKYKRILSEIVSILIVLNFVAVITYICINNFKYIRIGAVEIITSILINLFIIYISNDIIKNVIITSCTFGILFTFTTDYNHAIDEKKHFMTALNISFLNFDYINKPITDKKIEELPQIMNSLEIDEFLTNDYNAEITHEVNMEDTPSTPATYSLISYVFPAIGITFARVLNGSIIDMYICGRIMNLIIYTILIVIAIKIIPYKKNIFFVIAFMPFMLLLASSYSIDGICLGTVFIFVAYCLKMYKENITIKMKQLLILGILFLIMLTGKGIAYILTATIILILPIYNTIKQNKKYRPMIISSIIILLILAIIFVIYMKNTMVTPDGDNRGEEGINGVEQLEYISKHPVHDLKLIIYQIKVTLFDYEWYIHLYPSAFFGENSNYVFFIMMLYILYVSITEDDYNFKIKDKVIFLITFLLVLGMTSGILYLAFTPVGATYISGYQTRYILPILPLMLFCLSNDMLKNFQKTNRNMNIALIIGLFLSIGIFQLMIG